MGLLKPVRIIKISSVSFALS
uniref:Uncharacterized protein n=1 Tax=Arundo donax TaxID=35708 RepID=A0A0A8YGJ2_ARUDO